MIQNFDLGHNRGVMGLLASVATAVSTNWLITGRTTEKRLGLKSNRNQTIDHKCRQHVLKFLSRRLAPMALHIEAFLSRSSP